MARKKWRLVFGCGYITNNTGGNKMESKVQNNTVEEIETNTKHNINYKEYKIFGDPKLSVFGDKIERERFAKKGLIYPYKEIAEDFKEYYKTMMEEEYFYTKSDVAKMFDFNKQFVQKFMKKDFDLLLLSKSSRDILKCAKYLKERGIAPANEEQKEIYDLALKLSEKIDARNKIYFKKADILDWIKRNFKREVGKELKVIDDKEATEIFNKSLLRNKTIKELYHFSHDMQVTRLIKNKLSHGAFYKYIFYNAGNKRPIIRYMINENL